MRKALIVDDDVIMCNLTCNYLEKEDFLVYSVHSGEDALDFLYNNKVDIIILDLMLPGINGIKVCEEIKNRENTSIIMLTAKGQVEDRVKGLNIGADDYMVKPFAPIELVARIQAVLRRNSLADENDEPVALTQNNLICFDNLLINMDSCEVLLDGKRIFLPKREYHLMEFLARHPNKVFNRDQIINLIWGWDFDAKDRTVDVYIQRLRKRLKTNNKTNWSIRTMWGLGYKFEVISI